MNNTQNTHTKHTKRKTHQTRTQNTKHTKRKTHQTQNTPNTQNAYQLWINIIFTNIICSVNDWIDHKAIVQNLVELKIKNGKEK